MKQEYDDLLCEQFPKLYAERHLGMEKTCMCWGFAVGDGWYPIILGLSSAIQGHIDRREKDIDEANAWNAMVTKGERPSWWNEAEAPKKKKVPRRVPQVVVKQVKEKLGTLRFYYRGGDKAVDNFVTMAEIMSEVTCEACGAHGHIGGNNWISVQCDPCRTKMENERKLNEN